MKNEKSLTSAQQEIHCNSIPKEKIEKRIHLIGYNDSDWARDMDDKKKSTSGFVFYLGDTVFTSTSKK